MASAELSVVMVTADRFERLLASLRRLQRDQAAGRIELVLVVPSIGEAGIDPAEVATFHSHRVVETGVLATTGAEAVMVGRGAQGNPWALEEIVDGETSAPSREEVAAELVLFIREAVRELGKRRASSFLKKFYGWYLGQGRFPRAFKQELVQLESTEEVERRLLAAAPGATEILERLEAEIPFGDEVTLELPISVYGGG